jgi:hypothetical protein
VIAVSSVAAADGVYGRRLRANPFVAAAVTAALVGAAAGCNLRVMPLSAPRSCAAAFCVTPRTYHDGLFTVTADVEAPPGARLENATLRVDQTAGAPCQAGVPVALVGVDGRKVPEGPAAVGGSHRLQLRFSEEPDGAGYVGSHVLVELDFAVGAARTCVRAPLAQPKTAS